ncbi:MAG TPA: hypothetical protein VGB19_17060 [Actinomycetota bacterium]
MRKIVLAATLVVALLVPGVASALDGKKGCDPAGMHHALGRYELTMLRHPNDEAKIARWKARFDTRRGACLAE